MENRSSAKGVFIGFLTGGAIGSIAALLYAPKSGKELRKDIGLKGKKLMNETEDYLSTARSKASEIISDGRKKSEEIIIDAKNKAASILSQGKEYVTDEAGKIKDAVRAGVDTYREERKSSKH